jgi:hypothetical protein
VFGPRLADEIITGVPAPQRTRRSLSDRPARVPYPGKKAICVMIAAHRQPSPTLAADMGRTAMESRPADHEALRSVATAYVESWLDGDGDRMRGSLHSDLAKRGLDYSADLTPSKVHHLTADDMAANAAEGPRPQFARTCEITVLDLADNIASVKVVSAPFVDYLHLAKLDGRWSIVNVLYENRQPRPS